MKSRWVAVVFIIIILGLLSLWYYTKHPLSATVTIHGTTLPVEIAITDEEIQKGLSGRASLPPQTGMLFIFNHKERYSFWMKGMRFPLDFIWIDGNEVVEVTHTVPPQEGDVIPALRPEKPVDKVLEINAGEADTYGIKVGDRLLFNK